MYQSVFKDIWGSDLIFAGLHKTFTNVNKTSNIKHIIFGIHSVNSEPEIEDESWTDEQEYAIIADSDLGLTVNPFPLNPDDLLDVGGHVVPDFEELVDSYNHVMEECETNFSQHFCGVYKAIIPIARMRELADEDDTVDTITCRCTDCRSV